MSVAKPRDGSSRIPLRVRGGEVVAYALVDEGDFDRLNAHRWHRDKDGYACRIVKQNGRGHRVAMHRAILGLAPGDPRDTDHVNGDRLDNRRENLRACTRSENNQNRRSTRARSGHRHVYWHEPSRRWHVQLVIEGRHVSGGYFHRVEDAVAAATELRRLHFPFSTELAGMAA